MIILKGKKASKFRILISLFKKYKKAPNRRIIFGEEKFIFVYMKKTLVTTNKIMINSNHTNKYFKYTIKEGYKLKING